MTEERTKEIIGTILDSYSVPSFEEIDQKQRVEFSLVDRVFLLGRMYDEVTKERNTARMNYGHADRGRAQQIDRANALDKRVEALVCERNEAIAKQSKLEAEIELLKRDLHQARKHEREAVESIRNTSEKLLIESMKREAIEVDRDNLQRNFDLIADSRRFEAAARCMAKRCLSDRSEDAARRAVNDADALIAALTADGSKAEEANGDD